MKKDISILITGPLDDRTYESIDSYSDQGFEEIIVSTWDNENIDLLNKTNKKYKLVTYSYPEHLKKINNQGCRFYQSFTTWKGCTLATKPFVLRTRSDELYPDLNKFIKNWEENKERVHTTDNGFWKMHPCSFSTHVFGGPTQVVKEGCKMMVLNCENKFYENLKINYSEQCFAIFFMLAMGKNLSDKNWKQVFYENVFITPCSDLPDHLHSGQSFTNYKFTRVKDYPNNRPDSQVIKHQKESMYTHHSQFIA